MSVRRAVCPGSFDPVTHGHLDIFRRAAQLYDEVIVAVGVNPHKVTSPGRLFSSDERIEMLREVCADLAGVSVVGFTGLLTTFCVEQQIPVILKGVRAAADVDYEMPMAQMNNHLTGVETVFLTTDPAWSFVSSSLVKEVAGHGGEITGLVPDPIGAAVLRRLAERSS